MTETETQMPLNHLRLNGDTRPAAWPGGCCRPAIAKKALPAPSQLRNLASLELNRNTLSLRHRPQKPVYLSFVRWHQATACTA